MIGSDFDEARWISNWAEAQCRHIDVVASWETLTEVYDQMRFNDPMSDEQRVIEYRWVIGEVNKFLTRQRKVLHSCKNFEAAIEKLQDAMIPEGKVKLDMRQQIVYHKLRQRWLTMAIQVMRSMQIDEMEETDGWN